jgi:hypothetical protein
VTGLLRAQSARSFFLPEQGEMRVQFLSKVVVQAGTADEIPNSPEW